MSVGSFIDQADGTDDQLYGQGDEGNDPCCQGAEGIYHRRWKGRGWCMRRAHDYRPVRQRHEPGRAFSLEHREGPIVFIQGLQSCGTGVNGRSDINTFLTHIAQLCAFGALRPLSSASASRMPIRTRCAEAPARRGALPPDISELHATRPVVKGEKGSRG